MIGKMLGNRYEILEQLGGGGMAIVYKGRDTILHRLVTIKLLRPEYSMDEDFVRRFRREAQAIASLSHPNIVSIYDVGKEEDRQYLVMEYVDGEDLRSIIRREGNLKPDHAVRIARQICEALDHAHENNIVHRDVKPHNILITRTGRAKLTDFGIAREAGAPSVTSTDKILGSVHYLSPEQARGEPSGPKSDLYSLGVVLYEMITGGVPFTGDSPISVALKHIQDIPESPARRMPGIPPGLERIVLKSLHKDPDKRPASAREFSCGLEESLQGEDDTTRLLSIIDGDNREIKKTMQIPREGSAHKPGKTRRISPAGWILLVLLVVFLAGFMVYGAKQFLEVPEVVVPSVVDMPYEDAREVLEQKKLKVSMKEDYHPTVPEGAVIKQDVGPKDPPVKIGRVINLTVSKGMDLVTVPDLYRLNVNDARVLLVEQGLKLREPPVEESNPEIEKGLVFKQEPEALEKAPRGSEVELFVSTGPVAVDRKVPVLKGLNVEKARIMLEEMGLELAREIIREPSSEYLSGQIVYQFPTPGEMVAEGTFVKVNVSSGPGPAARDANVTVRVPNDGKKHLIRISITDIRGTGDVYIRQHNPGEQVSESVRYWGRAVIRVYADEHLMKEETVN